MTPFVHVRRIPGLRALVAFAALGLVASLAQPRAGARHADAGPPQAPSSVTTCETRSAAPAPTAQPVTPAPAVQPVTPAPAVRFRDTMFGQVVEPTTVPATSAGVGVTRVDDTHYAIGAAWLDAQLQRPGDLARSARIMPRYVDGALHGLRLYAVRPSSPLVALGLKNGDTVLTLDGVDLATPEHPFGTYALIRNLDHHELLLERKGARLTLHYDVAP